MALDLTLNIQSTTAATRVNTTVTKPTSTASGDLLIAVLYWEGHIAVTAPAGWTLVKTFASTLDSFDVAVWYLVAGGSEGANYTWTHASQWSQGAIQRVTGAPATSPIDGTPTANEGTGTTATGTGLTTAQANSALFLVVTHFTSGRTLASWTAGLTERLDASQFGFASGVQAAAGASGNKTATVSASDDWAATLFAVKDASAAAAATSYLPPSRTQRTHHVRR